MICLFVNDINKYLDSTTLQVTVDGETVALELWVMKKKESEIFAYSKLY